MGESSKKKKIIDEAFPEDESSSEEEQQPSEGSMSPARYSGAEAPRYFDTEMPRKCLLYSTSFKHNFEYRRCKR